jgi:hypothetical protein
MQILTPQMRRIQVKGRIYDLRDMAVRRSYEVVQGVHRSRIRLQSGAQRSLQQQRRAIPKQSLRWQTA